MIDFKCDICGKPYTPQTTLTFGSRHRYELSSILHYHGSQIVYRVKHMCNDYSMYVGQELRELIDRIKRERREDR